MPRQTEERKRTATGRYEFEGGLDRVCVCGHTLGDHSGADSPKECLFYSFPEHMQKGQPGENNKDCRCTKFRESRRKVGA